jgi:hypothetical protein
VSQENSHLGIVEHESQTVRGSSGVKGEVSGTRFKDGQERDNHIERAGEAETNQVIRSHSLVAQEVSQLVGAVVERRISELVLLEDDSDAVGGLGGLSFKQFVVAVVRHRVGQPGVVPGVEQLLSFWGR